MRYSHVLKKLIICAVCLLLVFSTACSTGNPIPSRIKDKPKKTAAEPDLAPPEPMSPRKVTDVPDDYINSYYQIVASLVKKTGIKQDDLNALGGVTLAMLIDFDDNGILELVCSYCEPDTDWPPIIEVYGHDGSDPVLISKMELGEQPDQTDVDGYLYAAVINGVKYIMFELPKDYNSGQQENNCVLTVKGLTVQSLAFSASRSSASPEIDNWYETAPLDRADLFYINGKEVKKEKYVSEYTVYNSAKKIAFDVCWGGAPHEENPYAESADPSKYGCQLIDLHQVNDAHPADYQNAFSAYAEFVYRILYVSGYDFTEAQIYLSDIDNDDQPELVLIGSYGGTGPCEQVYLADCSRGSLKTLYVNEAVSDQVDLRAGWEYDITLLKDKERDSRFVISVEGSDMDYYSHPLLGDFSDVDYDQKVWVEISRDMAGNFKARAMFTEVTLNFDIMDEGDLSKIKKYYIFKDRLCSENEYTQQKTKYLSGFTEHSYSEDAGGWYNVGWDMLTAESGGGSFTLSDGSEFQRSFAQHLAAIWGEKHG